MLCSRSSPLRFLVNGSVRARGALPAVRFPTRTSAQLSWGAESRAFRTMGFIADCSFQVSSEKKEKKKRKREPRYGKGGSEGRSGTEREQGNLESESRPPPTAPGRTRSATTLRGFSRRAGPGDGGAARSSSPAGGRPVPLRRAALSLSLPFGSASVLRRGTRPERTAAAAAPPVASLGRVRGRKRRGESAGCGRRSVPAIRGWKPSGPRSAGTKRRETRSSPLPIPAPAGADALWVGGGGACARRRWI